MGCASSKTKVAPAAGGGGAVEAPKVMAPQDTEKRIVRVMTARKLADDTKRRQRRSKIACVLLTRVACRACGVVAQASR